MKRFVAAVLTLSLAFCCVGYAFAEQIEEKPILFRNVPWGSTMAEAKAAFPAEVGWYNTDYRTSYTVEKKVFDGKGTLIDGDVVAYIYPRSSTLTKADLKVAGYAVSGMHMTFGRVPGADGLLIDDEAYTALFEAEYTIEPMDLEAAYADLLEKLTSLYGEVDYTKTDNFLIIEVWNVWYGADGTMVSLHSKDYPSGTKEIHITYATMHGDEMLETAKKALAKAESASAASNFDGL